MYQQGLSKAGIDCEIALDAKEGLRVIKNFQPDLIVADIMMPDIDGFEFREMILRDNEISSIPFAFLSNLGSDQQILHGFDKDIADYILKSSGYKIVIAKISSLIKSLKKERNKAVTELREASDFLKTSVVAEKFPDFENFNIQYWHVPYSGIPGGDFIDYFLLDDDHLSLVLGDVMGKKWGAWYFAYAYAGYIRSAIHSVIQEDIDTSPSKIISRVNKLVHQDSKISEVFSTLSIVVIDKNNLTLKYSGAGDLPIFYKNSETGEIRSVESKGPLLGFTKDALFTDSVIQMSFGDTVILSTDGLIESRNDNDELFGVSRLLKVVQNQEFLKSPLQVIKDNLMTFNNHKFDDDISIVSISASE